MVRALAVEQERRIQDLPEVISGLEGRDRMLVQRMIMVHSGTSDIGQENVDPSLQRQQVVEVYNRWDHRRAVFNGVRSFRPQPQDKLQAYRDEISGNFGKDPFCNLDEKTPPGPFGRVRGSNTVTAANLFAGALNHAVLIYDQHDPLYVPSQAEMQDRFNVADGWYQAAHAHNGSSGAIYPSLIENRTRRAAASIPHGHGQLALREGVHEGVMEQMRDNAEFYRHLNQGDYFDDLRRVHEVLGLGLDLGGVRVYPSLTPTKEGEVDIFADQLNSRAIGLIHKVYSFFDNELGMPALNMLAGFRPLKDDGRNWGMIPGVVVRVIGRGDLGVSNSDIGGFELFGTSIIATDPYVVDRKLKQYLKD